MASSISFPGLASGIDSSGIAKAIKDQYTVQNKVRENKISRLESENTSLEKLRTSLLDLADKLDGLRSISGGASTKTAESANTDIVKVAADSSAKSGTFAVTVSSLAQNASGSFDRGFNTSSELIAKDASQTGKLEFTVGTGENAKSFSVEVTSTTAASKFVEDFNKKADGKASASLVNVGTEASPEYRIMFSSSSQGVEAGSLTVSSDNEAFMLNDALGGVTMDQATDAQFSISGINGTIRRTSNDISDVVSGVSLQLQSKGTTVVTVNSQAGVSSKDIESFVNAYNSLVDFVNSEDVVAVKNVDGENVNQFRSLARTNVDNRAVDDLRSAVLGTFSSDGSILLAALGVSTERDGTLAFDKVKFQEIVGKNPDKAAEVVTNLADKVSGVSGVVHSYTGYDMAIDSEVAGNEEEIKQLNETISKVEKSASEREQAILKQFSGLEGIIANLNSQAAVISKLLSF